MLYFRFLTVRNFPWNNIYRRFDDGSQLEQRHADVKKLKNMFCVTDLIWKLVIYLRQGCYILKCLRKILLSSYLLLNIHSRILW